MSPIRLAHKLGFDQGQHHDENSGLHAYIDLGAQFAASERSGFHLHGPRGFVVFGASAIVYTVELIVDRVVLGGGETILFAAAALYFAAVVVGRRGKKLEELTDDEDDAVKQDDVKQEQIQQKTLPVSKKATTVTTVSSKSKTNAADGSHKRPRGAAPKGKAWDSVFGEWIDEAVAAAVVAVQREAKQGQIQQKTSPSKSSVSKKATTATTATTVSSKSKTNAADGSHKRPRGAAPKGKAWDSVFGEWIDEEIAAAVVAVQREAKQGQMSE